MNPPIPTPVDLQINPVDIIQIIVTIFLGIAALVFAKSANKLTKQSNKIALHDRVYLVFDFFSHEIWESDFFIKENYVSSMSRIAEIEFQSNFLFNAKTEKLLGEQLSRIINVFIENKFPPCNDEDFNKSEVLLDIKKFLDNPVVDEQAKLGLFFKHSVLTKVFEILKDYKLKI